jgi:N-acetylglucosamine PTS system EIICBA or EIICB component
MSTAAAAVTGKKPFPGLAQLQRLGRSLMMPIAVLPAAGLLARLGSNDMLGGAPETGADPAGLAQFDGLHWLQPVSEVMGAAGNALLGNLGFLFAIGVAIGFAKKSDGSTALAALTGYLVFQGVNAAMSPHLLGTPTEEEAAAPGFRAGDYLIDWSALGGIVIGITAALLWQRYHRKKLPPYLAFFGGRRFVPIVTSFVSMIIAVLMAFIYKPFSTGLMNLGEWTAQNDVVGGGIFGFFNRLLIPLGLHHILNSFPWFQLPSSEADVTAVGDIPRFLAQDPTAGTFQTGFFPIMMFALPAAAIAIWHTAKPKNRKAVGGIMISAALTSFLTGVTEPIEFSFMFVAFPLYLVHAVLTGTSLALVNALGIRDGFSFSAGAIDYLINFRIAEQPVLLFIIGIGYAVLYYFLFRWIITRFKLKTPGREDEGDDAAAGAPAGVIVDQPEEPVKESITTAPPADTPPPVTADKPKEAG